MIDGKQLFLNNTVGKPIMAAHVITHKSGACWTNSFQYFHYYGKDDYLNFLSKFDHQYFEIVIDIWFKDGTSVHIEGYYYGSPIHRYNCAGSFINDEKLPYKLKVFSNGKLCPYELLEILERSEYKIFTPDFLFKLIIENQIS